MPGPGGGECLQVLDALDIALVFFAKDGSLVSLSAAARGVFGDPRNVATREQLSRLPWSATGTQEGDTVPTPYPWSDAALAEKAEVCRLLRLELPGTTPTAFSVRATRVPESAQSSVSVVVYFKDITAQLNLENSLLRNSQLLEASQTIAKVGGWELNLETGDLFWTAETYRLHDASPDDFIPTVDAVIGFYLPESRRRIKEAHEAAVTKGEGYDLELETLTTKGRQTHVRTTCEVTCREGRPVKLTGTFQDITAAKEVEVALRQAARFSQDTLNALDANICVLDETGTIVAVNQTWLDFAGAATSDAVDQGMNYLDVCDAVQGEDGVFARKSAAGIRAVISGEQDVFYLEYPCETPQGSRWFAMRASQFRSTKYARVVVAHSDITERWSAQYELRESQSRLRRLTRRLQQATEQESQRIAAVVHDDLGQQLTGLKMDLRAIERLLTKPDSAATTKALRRIGEATKLVNETVATVQRISSDLRPAILDQLGLWAALREEARMLEKRADLTCMLTLPESEPRLADGDSTQCYRIVREALTNIVRHAGATRVDVGIEIRGDEVMLQVEDNGRGIDPAKVDDYDAMGLLGMRERARQLGGVASIFPRPQGGTAVHVKFPLRLTGSTKDTP